jgi:hypothetical protein
VEGLTVILEAEEVKPAGLEVQEYVFPTTAVLPKVVEAPIQIPLLVPAFAAGVGVVFTPI